MSNLLINCPECGRENYAPAVSTGKCAWCGYDANNPDDHEQKHIDDASSVIYDYAKSKGR